MSGASAKLFMSGYAIIGTSGKSAPPSSSTATGINYASTSGGGIYAESGPTIYLGYSKWTDGGTSDQATLNGGVCYNYATSYGGGIYNYDSTLRLYTSSISFNKATNTSGGKGGAIYIYNYSYTHVLSGTITMTPSSGYAGTTRYNDVYTPNHQVWFMRAADVTVDGKIYFTLTSSAKKVDTIIGINWGGTLVDK